MEQLPFDPKAMASEKRLDALAAIFAEGLVALGESGQLGHESFVGEAARKVLIPGGNEGNS
ncbi:MAG TPA: hypothetical protein DCZ01_11365 [Elusimicrobia bacterium]|nr:MAG: hypothetical protein A2X37_00860 [Elusimicrobia bacterium GWA2_66_18]OGR70498.1 MAG: hypothetical protein A2X40_09505 [Elusimicrobia bacterium GWC2_65_9]HAZ09091.1 hypothetical protein [Elusimicrobiota bacterium]